MYLICKKKKIEIEECLTFFTRLKGFMFQMEPIVTGKRFPKCNSIHTYFMFQRIDVIMTDKNNKVIKMYPNLKSEKMIFPKRGVYYTYELPLGSCDGYKIGDVLKIKESD